MITDADKRKIADLAGEKARELQAAIEQITEARFRVTTLAQFDEITVSGTTWPSRETMRQAVIRLAGLWKRKAH